jgi:hypothetical protein
MQHFDVGMISRLFPEVAERANLVAGGSRKRVQDLYRVLDQVGPTIGRRFHAIVDRDFAPASLPDQASVRHWDRYHIENYLIEPRFIYEAVQALTSASALHDEAAANQALRIAAATVVPAVLRMRLTSFANDRLVREVSIGASGNPGESIADALRPSIEGSLDRFVREARGLLDEGQLQDEEQRNRDVLVKGLESDRWIAEIPGRLILRRFVADNVPGVSYTAFRNLLVDLMVRADHRPPGMASVLSETLA